MLKRGQYDMPDTSRKLEPGVPSCLPPLPAGAPRNRLGLARWLVSPENPLTARVAVNRIWQHHFGTGLVKTAENFGVQGEPPSHPELLDWLATELVRTGLGHEGDAPADRHQRDLPPGVAARRRRCWRTTRRTACWRAGRGSGSRPRWCATTPWRSPGCWRTRIGGPSVKPYQPAGLWEELAGGAGEAPYVQDKGPNLYRRSLYVYRKRTVPHPVWPPSTPPAARSARSSGRGPTRRSRPSSCSTTSTYVEAARQLAQLTIDRGRLHARRADRLTPSAGRWRACRRPPSWTVLRRGLERYSQGLSRRHASRAEQLIRHGESPPDPKIDPRRAGRLHGHRRRHPQPGRDHHARVSDRNRGQTVDELKLAQQFNRRLFLQSSGVGLGAMALGSLLDGDGPGAAPTSLAAVRAGKPERRRRPAGPAAFPAQGQAGDLPVPVRRTVADGPVRLQAGARATGAGSSCPTRCGWASGSRR